MFEGTTYEVLFYRSPRGECFAEVFLDGLPAKVRGKVLRWIEALEAHGPNLPRTYADVVQGKVRELRIVFGASQYRLLCFFAGKRIVVTHGFIKKTGPVPIQELDRAERLMQDWQSRRWQGGCDEERTAISWLPEGATEGSGCS